MLWAAFAGVVLLIYLAWLFIPVLFGLPWIPTRIERARKALQLAQVKADETVYDLGAGDGRILLLAAQEFDAQAVGVEIGPVQCLVAWLRALFSGSQNRIRIRWENFYQTDFSQADVVFVYMTSKEVARLQPRLAEKLRPGARVVSISADFRGWQPVDCDLNELIFVYHMPPQVGGVDSYLASK